MTVPLHFYDTPQFPAASPASWSPPAKAQSQRRVFAFSPWRSRQFQALLRPPRPAAIASVGVWRLLAVAAPQLAALAVMFQTETDLSSRTGFLLSWGILNFFWIALLRRPALSGALSLTLVVVLVLLSRLKHDIVQMTANFVDLMVIDRDTAAFLFTIFPHLRWSVIGAALCHPSLDVCAVVARSVPDPPPAGGGLRAGVSGRAGRLCLRLAG